MRYSVYILVILLAASCLLASVLQPRRLFEYEQRFGDTRPKPDLTPNKASLRSGERLGEGSAKSPGWQPNGICICDTAYGAGPSIIVSDGKNGAIVCWTERYRGWPGDTSHALEDIYAQRVDSGGNERWPHQGVPVCSLANTNASFPAMVPDGHGGVVIAWVEYGRIPDGYTHVYAQRLDSLGDRLWPENGVLVCSQPSGYIDICTDGHGGAIIAWVDGRNEAITQDDIYAQRVDSAGNMVWQEDGVPVCVADSIQFYPHMCSNHMGGAIIDWAEDYRNGNYDVYAQLLDSLGNSKWIINGEPIMIKPGIQGPVNPICNNHNSYIIGWSDFAGDSSYVQQLDSLGNKMWGSNGIETMRFGLILSDQRDGVIVATVNRVNRLNDSGNIIWGAGVLLHPGTLGASGDVREDNVKGVVAVWSHGTYLYAQRVDSSGAILWNPSGVPVCITMDTQTDQKVVGDEIGGAYATWCGNPDSSGVNEIWVQRIRADGTLCGVKGETLQLPVLPALHLQCSPNPFICFTNIQYALAEKQEVSLKVYSIMGQLVKTLYNGQQAANRYTCQWDGRNDQGKRVSNGVYLIQLRTNRQTQTIKSTTIK